MATDFFISWRPEQKQRMCEGCWWEYYISVAVLKYVFLQNINYYVVLYIMQEVLQEILHTLILAIKIIT